MKFGPEEDFDEDFFEDDDDYDYDYDDFDDDDDELDD